MQIDYGKIVTNALSALVAAVFVGAAAIVWIAANSIDDKVKAAKDEMIQQQAALKAIQEIMSHKITNNTSRAEENRKELKSINKVLSELDVLHGKVTYDANQPFILKEFREKKDIQVLKKEELDKLSKEIDTRQMQIYEQKVKR